MSITRGDESYFHWRNGTYKSKSIWDFPFTRLKNTISPYDINEITEITSNNQECLKENLLQQGC